MSNYRNSDANADAVSAAFSALANPHRLRIYSMLSGCCLPGTQCDIDMLDCCQVGDIGSRIDIAPSTLSHHLKELNRAGLIRMTRKGRRVTCAVEPEMLETLGRFFQSSSPRSRAEATS